MDVIARSAIMILKLNLRFLITGVLIMLQRGVRIHGDSSQYRHHRLSQNTLFRLTGGTTILLIFILMNLICFIVARRTKIVNLESTCPETINFCSHTM
jgi:hypothetical protein